MPALRLALSSRLPAEWSESVAAAGAEPVALGEDGRPADGSDPTGVGALLTARLEESGIAAALGALPALRWMHVTSAGVDWLDLPSLAARRLVVTNASGVYDIAIAEHVLAALLAHAKRTLARRDAQARARWEQDLRNDTLARQCVGVVGFGSIGREVARLAKAFRMRVEGLRRRQSKERLENVDKLHHPDGLHRLLKAADHVVLCAPLTAATRGMIGAAELARMRPTASLVNIARGALIDEKALLASLDEGRPAAAFLDVFAEEPLPEGHPFWTHPRVVVTPHSSYQDPHLAERHRDLLAKNVARWAAADGDPARAKLLNVVDLREGY